MDDLQHFISWKKQKEVEEEGHEAVAAASICPFPLFSSHSSNPSTPSLLSSFVISSSTISFPSSFSSISSSTPLTPSGSSHQIGRLSGIVLLFIFSNTCHKHEQTHKQTMAPFCLCVCVLWWIISSEQMLIMATGLYAKRHCTAGRSQRRRVKKKTPC